MIQRRIANKSLINNITMIFIHGTRLPNGNLKIDNKVTKEWPLTLKVHRITFYFEEEDEIDVLENGERIVVGFYSWTSPDAIISLVDDKEEEQS